MKCLSIDYTLLPMMTFVIKMIIIIYDTKNTSTDVNNLIPNILILVGFLLVVPTLYSLFKAIRKLYKEID